MKLYVVRWLHDYFYYEIDGGNPQCPAAARLVRAFTDPIEAEEYRQALERGRAAPPPEANPFHGLRRGYMDGQRIHCLADLTSLPEGVFLDWLLDGELSPPEPDAAGRRDWAAWWEASTKTMRDDQRRRVWQALDRIRFFEIVETELESG
jgi:hypothetical protein